MHELTQISLVFATIVGGRLLGKYLLRRADTPKQGIQPWVVINAIANIFQAKLLALVGEFDAVGDKIPIDSVAIGLTVTPLRGWEEGLGAGRREHAFDLGGGDLQLAADRQ